MNLNERIKKLRESRGMTQSELAIRMNVSAKTISTWESGFRNPKMSAILKLCDVFNVSQTWLMGIEESEAPVPKSASTPDMWPIMVTRNGSIQVQHQDGKPILVFNKLQGDFAEIYAKLDNTQKRFVIDCMMAELD